MIDHVAIWQNQYLYTVMICLSGHVCSRPIFPDKQVFRITESPISPIVEIDSHNFCPD